MSVATSALLLAGVVLAWRVTATVRAARAASRRWTLRAGLQWTLALVALDVGLVGGAVLAPVGLAGRLPASVAGLDRSRAVEILVAVALSAAVRRAPVRRGRRPASLGDLVLGRIERAAYDRADDWIYGVVYPTVPDRQMKPLLHAIRADLERRPGVRGSLDAAYIAALAGPGRTPSREDLRAACHRMLARDGRRRLARLVAEHGGPAATEPAPAEPKPADEAVWEAGMATERLLADLSPPTEVVRADVDPDALRWAGSVAASGARPDPDADTALDVSVYVRADDPDRADRVFRAVDGLTRIVGDVRRG